MSEKVVDDETFISLFKKGGASHVRQITGVSIRQVFARRAKMQRRLGTRIESPNAYGSRNVYIERPGRLHSEIKNGVVLVGSDCHYWPGPPSLMHRAFVKFCADMRPVEVILNGDVLDFGKISKYPPIGWTRLPSPQEEIEAAQERLSEIEKAAGRARKRWPLGNHDARFETRLATVAPEFAKVVGTSLSDHFPLWEPCWSVWVNDDVVIKHRYKGGIGAVRANVLNAGKHMISAHLHAAHVHPFTDYTGTRFGVDTGCIADPSHPSFIDYTEDSPKDWRESFCVLTFRDGQLMLPELVLRWDDNRVQFRGEVIRP